MLELLMALGVIVICIGFPVLMVRGLIQMWRHKGRTGSVSSGIAGSISELDRLVRPSVEHVREARDAVKKQEDNIGGD